jgi:predicted MFS family arabinose efflux permease
MCIAFAVLPPGPAQFALILAGALMMTGSIGPVCAVVVDVVHPALRSTAASVLSLTQNLFGLAAGPLLTGVMSDRYGLPFALSVVPLFCLLAAVIFVVAARTYESDLRNVAAGEPAYDDGLRPQAA